MRRANRPHLYTCPELITAQLTKKLFKHFVKSRVQLWKALRTDVAGRSAHRQGKPMQHAKRPAFSSGPKSQTVRLSPFPRGRARRRWAAPGYSRGSDRTKSLHPNQLQRI